ncbi:hypothetical protein ABZ477_06260 [Microbacterium sp. NPDC019599]|uniref:hypothetical protein n=1 Tax=Microbacterium sp. NPDC019599 TaxID=3154690 RepID=UPI003405DDC5
MVKTVAELRGTGLSSPLGPLLVSGDWYLVGSRATGHDDELSDWDTILLTVVAEPTSESPDQATVDAAFGVVRPALDGRPDLAFHIAWRSVGAVDLEVMGADAVHRRAEDLSTWAHELRTAVLLHRGSGVGERYRTEIAARFEQEGPRLAREAYRAYRLARNQAVSALARPDVAVQLLLNGQTAAAAARTWFLAAGLPAPGQKWLLPELDDAPAAAELAEQLRAILQAETPNRAERWFDAHLRIWELLDGHAEQHGIATD